MQSTESYPPEWRRSKRFLPANHTLSPDPPACRSDRRRAAASTPVAGHCANPVRKALTEGVARSASAPQPLPLTPSAASRTARAVQRTSKSVPNRLRALVWPALEDRRTWKSAPRSRCAAGAGRQADLEVRPTVQMCAGMGMEFQVRSRTSPRRRRARRGDEEPADLQIHPTRFGQNDRRIGIIEGMDRLSTSWFLSRFQRPLRRFKSL